MRETVERKKESRTESSNTQHADDTWDEMRRQPHLSQCPTLKWLHANARNVTCESFLFTELLSRPVCQLTTSFHTFLCVPLHVIRPRRNNADFEGMVIVHLFLQKFWIETWFGNCQQYLCLFRIVFECSQDIHDLGKMLVLPDQFLCLVLSTSD